MIQGVASDWNPQLGLYRKAGPGHTEPVSRDEAVHSFPETFIAFAIDAQLDRLDESRLELALRTLRATQVREAGNPLDGCLRWYYEEPQPVDTNASFFVGLTLLIIETACGARLGRGCREELNRILAGLKGWFLRELEENKDYYPNKTLGDLVCAWLLSECLDDASALERLAARFRKAVDYWRKEHWGWGEHLSQVYTTVILTEISALLFLQRRLPADVAADLRDLAGEPLRLQDFFDGGPWTPAIRSYAFTEVPGEPSFRRQVRRWDPQADAEFLECLPEYRFMRVCFAAFFHQRGWHDVFPPETTEPPDHVTVRCSGGVVAKAYKAGPLRLGSLSRSPLRTEWDDDRWGLSWQSFPVAAACAGRLWAYPQWRVRWQDGTDRCHPAHVKSDGYLRNALVPDGRAFTGMTEAAQDGMACEIRRTLPAWHAFWGRAADGWNIICRETPVTREFEDDGWRFLEVEGAGCRLTIGCRPPRQEVPRLLSSSEAPHLRWELSLAKEDTATPVQWTVRLRADDASFGVPFAKSDSY